MDIKPKALIVGAGPTGLFLACELARYEIPFRIIDKKTEATKTSNAVGIQTRTLEIFSDVGIIEPFITQGVHRNRTFFKFQKKTLLSFDLTQLDSIFKYILLLPQSKTEAILTEHLSNLGHTIERGKTLTQLINNSDSVSVEIDGETSQFDWVIGCDGAHSTVREHCNIHFPGDDIQNQFIVADVKLAKVPDPNAISAYIDYKNTIAIFPLGNDRYRIAADRTAPKTELTDNEIKNLITNRISSNIDIKEVCWASPFWIHSKLVDNMQHKRVFLAGDAAHIHSPVGGQGMNTGIQDAYNLAWKLAYVIKAKADKTLLKSYQEERWPVIHDIVKRTEKSTKSIISKNKILTLIRNMILRFVNTQDWMKKKAIMQLTQLSTRYINSPIIDYTENPNPNAPQPGMRMPDIVLNNGRLFHSYLKNKEYNLIIFNPKNKIDTMQVNNFANEQLRNLGNNVHRLLVSDTKDGDISNPDIFKALHISAPCVYILRPDFYIQNFLPIK